MSGKKILPAPANRRAEGRNPNRNSVLIGVVRRAKDLQLIRKERWYRVPARHRFRRPVSYIAFYLTAGCGSAGKAISRYAEVKRVSAVPRRTLLPDEKDHPRAEELYLKYELGPVRRLPRRIENRLRRRIFFAYTSLSRLRKAKEIGELFDLPPLEEVMRINLEKSKIAYFPQQCVMEKKKCRYRLDFAIFSPSVKLAVECDHSRWHSRKAQRERDRKRDRWLRRRGWKVLHFSEEDILEHPGKTIAEIRKQLG